MKRLLLLALLSLPLRVLAEGGLPERPYLYVEGVGRLQRDADLVTLSFTLTFFDQKLSAATTQVQDKAAKVFALLDAEKIAPRDVVSESLQWTTARENEEASGESRGAKGYTATREFSVTLRDVNVFPRLIDELLAIGVEQFRSVEGGLSNKEQLTDQARSAAIADARARAEKTLRAEKMKIDSLFAVSSVPFPQVRGEIVPNQGPEPDRVIVGPASMAPVQYRLAPVTVAQSAHVIYLISPAP